MRFRSLLPALVFAPLVFASVARPHTESASLAGLPLSFVPNVGQAAAPVQFQANSLNGTLFFTPDAVVLSLPVPDVDKPAEQPFEPLALPDRESTAVNTLRLRFEGANSSPHLSGTDAQPGVVNYFRGNDPSRWRTDVPTYGTVIYHDLYPGIDLRYDGAGGSLKGTYTVAAGADPARIRWRYEGAEAVTLEGAELRVRLPGGNVLAERAPVAWQEVEGTSKPVDIAYVLAADGSVSFSLGAYDTTYPLQLDPELVYSTYLGGNGDDIVNDVATDNEGNVYIVGRTDSTHFPVSNPYQSTHVSTDAFITKFNPAGTALVYSTYLGGSDIEEGYSIALDSDGNVYVTGDTYSSDFPVVNAYQNTLKGQANAFVMQLNSAGDALVYSTYLGGSQFDQGFGIAVDSAGSAYVVGLTDSGDFPTVNALQPAHHDPSACSEIKCDDAYITKFAPDGQSLVYSTYLGGNNRDLAFSIALDSGNNAYITGSTSSSDFPTAHPYQAQLKSCKYMDVCDDAFVTKISASGDSLLYSTYLGGNEPDRGLDIVVDNQRNAYIVGFCGSIGFPTTKLYPSSQPDADSAFITKFAPNGSSLRYSVRIDDSIGRGIALDTNGHIYVTGVTWLTTFPLVSPLQRKLNGASDDFIMKMQMDTAQILFSTYWGGSDRESDGGGTRIAVDNIENLTVVGTTKSTDFPVYNALQSTPGQYFDTTVTKIMTLPPEAMRGAPERNYFATTAVTLTWSAVSWAGQYQVQIARTNQFTSRLEDVILDANTLSHAWTAPGGGKYYWHVRAKKPDGQWSAWSITDSFYVGSVP
jgi:hypothetical protein